MTVKELKDLLAKYPDDQDVDLCVDYATSEDYPDDIEDGCDTGVVAVLHVDGDTLIEVAQEM